MLLQSNTRLSLAGPKPRISLVWSHQTNSDPFMCWILFRKYKKYICIFYHFWTLVLGCFFGNIIASAFFFILNCLNSWSHLGPLYALSQVMSARSLSLIKPLINYASQTVTSDQDKSVGSQPASQLSLHAWMPSWVKLGTSAVLDNRVLNVNCLRRPLLNLVNPYQLLVINLEISRRTRSIPWLLMSWLLV